MGVQGACGSEFCCYHGKHPQHLEQLRLAVQEEMVGAPDNPDLRRRLPGTGCLAAISACKFGSGQRSSRSPTMMSRAPAL